MTDLRYKATAKKKPGYNLYEKQREKKNAWKKRRENLKKTRNKENKETRTRPRKRPRKKEKNIFFT